MASCSGPNSQGWDRRSPVSATELTRGLGEQHGHLTYRPHWSEMAWWLALQATVLQMTRWPQSRWPGRCLCSCSPSQAPSALGQKGSCELFENILRASGLGERSLINHSFVVVDLSFKHWNVSSLGEHTVLWNPFASRVGGAEIRKEQKF